MANPLKQPRPLYWAWQNMKKRCNDPKDRFAYRYSERGIQYDPGWETFEGFYADMGSTHQVGLSLDRIDNNKGYSKDNCRWATPRQQANNMSTNRKITIGDRTMTLAQWCDLSPAKASTVRQRFYVYHWPIEKALELSL